MVFKRWESQKDIEQKFFDYNLDPHFFPYFISLPYKVFILEDEMIFHHYIVVVASEWPYHRPHVSIISHSLLSPNFITVTRLMTVVRLERLFWDSLFSHSILLEWLWFRNEQNPHHFRWGRRKEASGRRMNSEVDNNNGIDIYMLKWTGCWTIVIIKAATLVTSHIHRPESLLVIMPMSISSSPFNEAYRVSRTSW